MYKIKKICKRILILILCNQLILLHPFYFYSVAHAQDGTFSSPTSSASTATSTTNNTTNSYENVPTDEEFYKEDESKTWDDSLRRCFNSENYELLREGYQGCTEHEDPAHKKKCFDEVASYFVGNLDTGIEDDIARMRDSAEALGYIQLIIELIAKEGAKSDCWSGRVNAAGGIIGLAVDLYLTFFVEDELHELQDRYKTKYVEKKLTALGSYETQLAAFNYLHAEQEILAEIDYRKTIAYGVMTGVYGLAFLLSIYEMTPWGALGACRILADSNGTFDDLAKARKAIKAERAAKISADTASGFKRLAGALDDFEPDSAFF